MKLKHIFIIIGSMVLLYGLLQLQFGSFIYSSERDLPLFFSVLGLGILLTGIFWKKQ